MGFFSLQIQLIRLFLIFLSGTEPNILFVHSINKTSSIYNVLVAFRFDLTLAERKVSLPS